MSKKKRSKTVQIPLSPEKYIRNRCRSLPIEECYINNSWKEDGIAQIFITRKHSNDNITVGIYFVDIYCLGVKYTYYRFNIPQFELDDLIESTFKEMNIVPINYKLAHNIIYGAIAYAEDYGFSPHKDFTKITQFVLEEDDENVELVELEFGHNGKPLLLIQDKNESYDGYLRTLEKTAGKGNFEYILPFGESSDGYLDQDTEEDFMYRFYDNDLEKNIIRELGEMNDEERNINFESEEFLLETYYRVTELLFADTLSDKEKKEAFEFGEKLFDIKYYDEDDTDGIDGITDEDDWEAYSDALVFLANNKPKKALRILKILMVIYPENCNLIFYMEQALLLNKKVRKANELAIYAYQKFPDDLIIKIQYLNYLFRSNRLEEMEEILNNGYSLQDIYPETEFFKEDVLSYYKIIFRFFVETNQMLKARVIFFQLDKHEVDKEEMDFYHEMMINNTTLFLEKTLNEK
jgi:hypothetical protein